MKTHSYVIVSVLVALAIFANGTTVGFDNMEYSSNYTHPNTTENVLSKAVQSTPVQNPARSLDEVLPVSTVEQPVLVEKKKYYDIPLSHEIQDYIFKLCAQYNIESSLIIAIIKQESRYQSDIIGDHGRSFGLMQIQPKWHKNRMNALNCNNLLDPYQNITVGIDLLSELIGQKGSVSLALMVYNSGAGVANRMASEGKLTEYASEILENSKILGSI